MDYQQIKTMIETYTACVNAAYSNTYFTATIDANIPETFITYLKDKILEMNSQFDYKFGRKDCECLWFDHCQCNHVYTIFINKNHLLMDQVLLDNPKVDEHEGQRGYNPKIDDRIFLDWAGEKHKCNDKTNNNYVCDATDFDTFVIHNSFYDSKPNSPRELSNEYDLISLP